MTREEEKEMADYVMDRFDLSEKKASEIVRWIRNTILGQSRKTGPRQKETQSAD